ncbi:major facilitator superfamily MFS_1 [Fructobacillus pseudoficulneus]|uniref:Major facilitator superfamily MFS_1 n=1 Tax=Fructobacillus pseudoficulneus TaxID=220714 RepID=A0A3F3HBE7_9LACO|nr:MFS transporter [Fructobacillus pseudoficulneus]GAP03313.1 major facilitator superfamily MFS_1 [Fructobacillus pseudoficulneus]SEH44108.1 drug resistance transporter, EmrB/QacA subfamily [Fructobacillus pseudoficulneus]
MTENLQMNFVQMKKAALVVAAALFMQMLDSTIVTTALPQIATDLQVNQSTASLLVSVYMLFSAIFIPLSGWLSKKVRRKNLFLLAVGLFTISSVLAGLFNNLTYLLVMRAIQGMAGALMVPVGRLIILENTEPKKMLQILSYLVWPALLAPAIAPLLGGYVISALSWHWIFFLNLPIGLLIILTGIVFILDDNEREDLPFDLLGFCLVALAGGGLLIASEVLARGLSLIFWGALIFFLALLFCVLAWRHLQKGKQPLFSLEPLKVKTFRIYETGGSIFWMTIGALPYLLTLLLQVAFHWSPVAAGTYVIFIFVGNIAIKPFTTAIIQRLGYKYALTVALSLATVATLLMAAFQMGTAKPWIAFVAFVSGVGRSLALTAYNSLSFSELSKEQKNSANTMTSVLQMLFQALGVGLVATIVAILGQTFQTAMAYRLTFLIIGLASLYPLIEVLTLPKDAGAQTLK